MVNNWLSDGVGMGMGASRSVMFVLFHGVNTTIMANLKWPILCHWTWSWEEALIIRARTSMYQLQHSTIQSGTLCSCICEVDKPYSTTQSQSSQHALASFKYKLWPPHDCSNYFQDSLSHPFKSYLCQEPSLATPAPTKLSLLLIYPNTYLHHTPWILFAHGISWWFSVHDLLVTSLQFL